LAERAKQQLNFGMMVFTRWMMVMTNFERALYADPEQDLNELWWSLVERYQEVKRPDGRNAPDWACKSHIAESPVYYHNYMLGEMTASQIQHYVEKQLGSDALIRVPQTGQWLTERLFHQGALRPWNEALEFLTGEKLKPEYFVSEFVRECAPATA
ncbi:MAG: peptidase M3A and M3B thimet/oligopeptidase F, partial [bacterium]|nr:peptidase M3A and M3B thimet/oligopeptidase F [bacterium]